MRTDTSWRSTDPLARRRIPACLASTAVAAVLLIVSASTAAAQQAAASLPPLPPEAQNLPDVVAKVNGQPISKRELLNKARSMRLQSLEIGNPDPAQSADFLSFVLEALIGQRLVAIDIEKRQMGPTEGEVDEKVQAIIATYGGEEGFAKALAEQGIDRAYVRQQASQSLAIDKVMEGEIGPEIQIAEETIKAYYEKFGDKMMLPATYRLRHILKAIPQGGGEETKQELRAQLEALRTQIQGGADFAALAREHTDDDRTREQGGEMPWIVFSGFEKTFENAVFALQAGEVSGVVETRLGFHILELLEKRPQRAKTLEEARNEIVNILAANEARAEIQRRVADLRARASIEILM